MCGLEAGLLFIAVANTLVCFNTVHVEFSIRFALIAFEIWLKDSKISAVSSALRKAGMENRLLELLPTNKREMSVLMEYFDTEGCRPICQYFKQRQTSSVKNEFGSQLKEMIGNGVSSADVVQYTKSVIEKEQSISETEAVTIIWDAGMDGVEWSNKQDLLQEQALKQAKVSFLFGCETQPVVLC